MNPLAQFTLWNGVKQVTSPSKGMLCILTYDLSHIIQAGLIILILTLSNQTWFQPRMHLSCQQHHQICEVERICSVVEALEQKEPTVRRFLSWQQVPQTVLR